MWWLDRFPFGPDPFSELRRLQREMNDLFFGFTADREPFPPVNVWTNDDNVIVTAELPGMDPDSIHVSVQGDQLSLEGERKAAETAEDVVCHRAERGSGRFSRTLRLPYEVTGENLSAKYRNGVLSVTLPRAERSKPRKIEIKSE